jgi:hypothetical protein
MTLGHRPAVLHAAADLQSNHRYFADAAFGRIMRSDGSAALTIRGPLLCRSAHYPRRWTLKCRAESHRFIDQARLKGVLENSSNQLDFTAHAVIGPLLSKSRSHLPEIIDP